jgi:L-alanine-DL-glutamate epimerase-like enolase superfamily enzyme
MKLTFTPHTLKFKHPFTIAAGSRDSTPVVFTELAHEAHTGYGEACMPPYLGESHESVMRFLQKTEAVIERWKDPMDIEGIVHAIDKIDTGNTAAKASIDIALHDLAGKLQNKTCRQLLNSDTGKEVFTSYTIGIDSDMDVIRQKVKESGSFRILKVKLGMGNDKEMIEAIRSVSDKPLSVDVNQGWKDKHFALDMIGWLKEMNVLFVEQPLPKENIDDAAWLLERSPLPVIADEAVQRLNDIEKIKHAYSGINIKLMKCTGMHEARLMITRARELGMKVLIGCMSESSCAVSAAAQLSPLTDWTDLDGPLLINNDPFEGVQFIDGRIMMNELPGIGAVRR